MATGGYRDWRVVRFYVGRRRLLSTLAGAILLAVLPDTLRLATCLILAWDLTSLLYIASTMHMISRSTVVDCHDHAALYDEGDWIILVLVIGAVAASFVCIAVEPRHLAQGARPPVLRGIVLTGLTALSWTFTHHARHAALRQRLLPTGRRRPGRSRLPGRAAARLPRLPILRLRHRVRSQTGDIATVSRAMRHLTMVHGIVVVRLQYRDSRADHQRRRQPAVLRPRCRAIASSTSPASPSSWRCAWASARWARR